MANTYTLGQSIRCSGTFTLGGIVTDPTTVTFRLLDGVGVKTTYVYGVDVALLKDGTGQYHVDLTPIVAGTYTYRWEGFGAENSAVETTFSIPPSAFYP